MLTRLLHRVVAHPRIYDLVQRIVGGRLIDDKVREQTSLLQGVETVLDVGGGTGAMLDMWSEGVTYVCLDLDPQKLSGFRERSRTGLGVQGDATRACLQNACVDAVVCKNMSHHIPEQLIDLLFAEAERVLKPGGAYLFVDALWEPRKLTGRLLWRFDRGCHPRDELALKRNIETHFDIRNWLRIAGLHQYVICLAVKKPASVPIKTMGRESVQQSVTC
jgi:ubiquinone/menaquinone biosynthesis C-methylase UbiE